MDLSLLGMLSAAGGGSSSSKKASGNPVQLDGLQGGVPFNSMTLSGKNLIKYPYYDGESKTMNGVTFTVNSDGSITANGTATARTHFHLHYTTEHLDFGLIPNQTYTFKACPSGASSSTYNASMSVWNGEKFVRGLYDYGNGNTFTRDNTTTHYGCAIAIEAGTTVENVVFRPQLELGDTATAYEPPITGRELTVNVSGKNLIPYPYAETTKTYNGITFTDNGDGTIAVDGTASSDAVFYFANKKYFIPSGNSFYLSGCPVGGSGLSYDIVFVTFDENNTTIDVYNDVGKGKHISVSGNAKTTSVYIRIRSGQTISNLIFRPQLELGTTPTPYEPYHGAECTITPDSNPYTVPVDIIQQEGLSVLSIADDSNPTISVSGNKASEQLGTIFRTLNNKPVLLFDGTIPTSSSAGYSEFTIDKEYSALIIVPICNESNVYEPGACTVIPIGYMTEEEQGFTAYGYPRAVQRVIRAFIKRVDNTIYLRSSSTACNRMTIYGI